MNGVIGVNTGELRRSAVDLYTKGRGIDFAAARFFSSAVTVMGPLGIGFDSPLFARIRALPNGNVEYYDGGGRRDLYTSAGGGAFTAPPGIFADLRWTTDGAVLQFPDNTRLYFDGYGRLARVADRNVTKADFSDGNVMSFVYGSHGELANVVDPTGRAITFDYFTSTASGGFEGALKSITDFDSRTVSYRYDANGRLEHVDGPDPASGASAAPSTTYIWNAAASVGNKSGLYTTNQLTSEKDGLFRTIYTAVYGSDPWIPASVTSGGGLWTTSFNSAELRLTDPNAHVCTYAHDADARLTSITEPGGVKTTYTYDSEGRLASVIRPAGDETRYGYSAAASKDRRPMSQVSTLTEVPRTGSPERAANMTRTVSIGYGPAGQPTSVQRPDGSTATVARDERGNPKSATDASGMTSTFSYDEHGLLKTLSDPRTGSASFTYVPDGPKKGLLQSATTPEGTATYDIDVRSNVKTITEPGGRTTNYTVNKLDQVEKVKFGSAEKTMSYDAAGNLKSRSVLAGYTPSGTPIYSALTANINEVGRLTTQTENGVTTTYGYDPAGNLKSATQPAAAPVLYGYDSSDRLNTINDGNGTWQLIYGPNGEVETQIDPRGNATTASRNGFGQKTAQKNPAGVTEQQVLDAAGRPVDTRMIKRLPNGDQLVLRWTQYEYDNAGRITKQIQKLFSSPLAVPVSGDPAGATDVVTRTIYDDPAHTVTTIDPRGHTSIVEQDLLGRPAKVTDAMGNVLAIEYDENGNRISEITIERRPDGTTEKSVMRYEYDDENRLTAAIDASDPAKPLVTHYELDLRGNVVSETDPDGRQKRYEYDLDGHRTKVTNPDRSSTVYTYDEAGRVASMKDANDNATTYTYDDAGNLESVTRGASVWNYTYDENGNRKTETDPNGTTVTYTYDKLDRLVTRSVSRATEVGGASSATFTYDDLGRIVATETDQGVKTFASYDSLDRLLTDELQIGNAPRKKITRSFDESGNVTGITYPSGLAITQTFDAVNRIASIKQSGVELPIAAYQDTGTRLTSKVVGNGIVETWKYDPNRRLAAIEDRLGTSLVRGVQYGLSPAGEKLSIDRADLSKRWAFERNANGWIVGESIERTGVQANSHQLIASYDADPVLNYRSITRTEQSGAGSRTTTIPVTIGPRNQYTQFGNETLRYDANGNLTARAGASLQYDADNHLEKVTMTDGRVVENLYDAAGRKVREVVNVAGHSQITDYVNADQSVIEEYVDDSLAARYVRGRGIDEVVRAERRSGGAGALDQILHPLQNELGTVDLLTDASGATAERYEYDFYGRVRVLDPGDVERPASAFAWDWLFQGRERSSILGSYDFRARTLWPDLGRFGQEDPLGPVDSPNLYQALLGNWTNETDPLGLEIELTGKPPYDGASGTLAHNAWFRFLNKNPWMGTENEFAFYNKSIDRIRDKMGKPKIGRSEGGLTRPDAVRLDRTKERRATIWELKPTTWDPDAGGTEGLYNQTRQQLAEYAALLVTYRYGRGSDIHPTGSNVLGLIPARGKTYLVTAYLGRRGANGGLVYYRLRSQRDDDDDSDSGRLRPPWVLPAPEQKSKDEENQDRRRRPVDQIAARIAAAAPCIEAHALTGAKVVAITWGAAGAVAGGLAGAVVSLPSGGTLTIPAGAGGALLGGAAGAIEGYGVGLIGGGIIGLIRCY
ncbi:MAG TPA: RHS repeat-associated core domain-containing protein [Thermoanaerobaculia bacterium]|nr:RHS repeat-associated core domain-containing protein [Thermoanaerobaculia bacterium]